MSENEVPANTDERDQLIQEIGDYVRAQGGTFGAEEAQKLIDARIDELVGDEEFKRKMTFAGDEGMGGKFRGLDEADVELLAGVVAANAKRGGDKPSDELQNAATHARRVARDELAKSARTNMADYAYLRAMDTAESGYGSQLIGAGYQTSLWMAARRQARVWPLIRTFQMQHPTEYLPVEVDFPDMLYVSENTANNSSNYSTSKTGSQRVSVSAKKFLVHQMWSGEMAEDSLVPYVPFLRGQLTKSLAWHQDALLINGDTTNAGTGNINLDDADPADTKYYLAWDGIRHVGLADNTDAQTDVAAAIAWGDLMDIKAKMYDSTYYVAWGHPPTATDLVYVSDPYTADKIAQLDEVVTIDKYGSSATVMTGEVGNRWGLGRFSPTGAASGIYGAAVLFDITV